MTDKYYPAFLEFKKAGENKYFVLNRNDQTTHIISSFEGELLRSLSGCKTWEEHLENIRETDKYGIADAVLLKSFNNWIDRGFLRNEILISNPGINKYSDNEKQQIISGCITCNRPDMLDRWLKSRVRTPDYKEKKTQILICDDTINSKISERNKNIINNHKKDYAGKIAYVDNRKKKILSELITQSISHDLPEGLVDFGLSLDENLHVKNTRGGNRNTMTLASAGFTLYSSDDDIEYSFFSRQNQQSDEYHFVDNFNSPTTFYPDMNSLNSGITSLEKINLLKCFESFIDSDISSLFKNNASVFLDNITAESAMFAEQNILQIRAIGAGYCGGRWYQNPFIPLFQQDRERELFFYDYENYKFIRNNGLNIKSADNYTLHNDNFLMGGTFCINNKNIISPCLPRGRRDDTNFAIILNKCLEPGLTLHLPFALYHNPDEKPPFSKKNFMDVSLETGIYSNLLLEKLTSSFLNPGRKERLQELGFRFQEFGKLKTPDFEEQLKLMQLGFLTKIMNHISYLLDLYEREPIWWAEDMEKYYELLKKEALSSESVVPSELRSSGTKEESLAAFQNYIFKCGEMLQWWPEIWEAARVINQEGRGPIDID